MSDQNHEKLGELLRTAVPPVGEAELKRDLWPQMLRRLEQHAAPVPWFDWALAGVMAAWFFFFPELIPILLYLL